MGDDVTETNTHATNKTNPYDPASGGVNDLITRISGQIPNTSATGAETGALNSLETKAQTGNPWAGDIVALASDLFKGGTDRTGVVNDAYSQYQKMMTPVTSTDYSDPTKNAGLQSWLSSVTGDVMNNVNSQAAAMGRTGSASQAQAAGRGVAAGIAPIYAQLEGNRLGAINGLYNAGNTTATTLSGLDSTALSNRAAGVGAANSALTARDAGDNATLAIEAQKRNLPLQNMGAISNLLMPMATSWGTSTTDQNSTTTKQSDPTKAIVGGVLGGLSLLGGNPMPLLGMGASMMTPSAGQQMNPDTWWPAPRAVR